MLFNGGLGGRAVEQQRKNLLFFDPAVLARRRVGSYHRRPARAESKRLVATHTFASERLHPRLERDGATRAGRHVLREIVDPGFVIHPTAGACGWLVALASHLKGRWQTGVAKVDHRVRKRDPCLPHLGHLALRRHGLHIDRQSVGQPEGRAHRQSQPCPQ